MLLLVNIYISCPINQAPHLLKYIHTTQTGTSRYPNSQGWIDYDKQFKLRKASVPFKSQSALDSELWIIYIAPPPNKLTPPSRCYDYNLKALRQSAMLHTHACMSCYGSHPRVLVYYPRHTRKTYTHIYSIKPTFSWTQFPLIRKPCHINVIIISKAKARSLNLA